MQDFYRKEVKLLKAMQGITYKEISEYLEIKQDSFYSWLKGNYDLGDIKLSQLSCIISNLKEV